jgi:5'-deoxynucleotidase YfbR-like HD superfamily hydrolase
MNTVNERFGEWMETSSGIEFYALDARENEICIEDIAHSLALMCRFNGHCSRFYSVAEHSVRVLKCFQQYSGGDYSKSLSAQRHVLLHDASEAYLCDIPRPIKPFLTNYKKHEENLQDIIYGKFQCKFSDIMSENTLPSLRYHHSFPKDVKDADLTLLATEARDLGLNRNKKWVLPQHPLPEKIIPYSSDDAERMFLEEFYKLEY